MHKIYFDGGTRLNSIALYDEDKDYYQHQKIHFKMTNNQLEYTALYSAVVYADSKYDLTECCFVGDSELVIKQMRGDYKVNDSILRALNKKICDLIIKEGSAPVVDMFEWVPRYLNHAGVYLEELG